MDAPRYGLRSLAEVVPGVLAALADRPPDDAVLEDGSVAAQVADVRSRVVVLVVDGLGARLLEEHAVAASTLRSCPGDDVDAVFPTTTVASIASIGAGVAPSLHGLVGYAWPLPDHVHPLSGLTWRIGLHGGGFDARAVVVPEQLQPSPTAFERASQRGIDTTVVVDPDFLDSGLTRAALRGGQRLAARGLATTLERAVHEASRGDGPALVYAHHPEVDWAGHVHGPSSGEVRDAVADVDRALAALLRDLPADVTVLVTADHGMLEVPEERMIELADEPALVEGVRVLAGEPRVRHVAVDDGVPRAEVAARWRAVLGDAATVLEREQALPLFGPDPSDRGREAVGDLVVLAAPGTALVHDRVDPHGGRMRGQHGGLSEVERLVPLRRLETPTATTGGRA